MNEEISDHMHIANDNLKRIADALDLIIKMVKEDQERSRNIWRRKVSRRPGLPMARVYLGHARWLEDQGPSYKRQAASFKRQA